MTISPSECAEKMESTKMNVPSGGEDDGCPRGRGREFAREDEFFVA
jgi:hypothetical protein